MVAHRSPTPRASSRSRRRAVGGRRAARLRRAGVSGCGACAAPSGCARRAAASRTWWRTRRRCRRPSKRCATTSRRRRRAWTGGWPASRRRCAARSPTARWCATTPTTSCPGSQSMSIALLDDERSGIVLSCIHHRDQARVYGKQVREGRGELELSPEEAEAVRLALAGGASGGDAGAGPTRRLRAPTARARVGYLGPGGDLQRGGAAARAPRRARVEPVRAGEHLRHRDGAAQRARCELGDRADRELARGLDQRDARPARRARRATCGSWARRCCGCATR